MTHGNAPVAEATIPVGLRDLATLMLAAKGYALVQQSQRATLDAGQQQFLVAAFQVVEAYCAVLGFDPAAFILGEGDA